MILLIFGQNMKNTQNIQFKGKEPIYSILDGNGYCLHINPLITRIDIKEAFIINCDYLSIPRAPHLFSEILRIHRILKIPFYE